MDGEKWYKENVGQLIRQKRIEIGITQDELSYRTGVDSKHIGKLENGNKLPNAFTLAKIRGALDLDTAGLQAEFKEKFFLENNVYKNSPK